jgi:hypothetical protein
MKRKERRLEIEVLSFPKQDDVLIVWRPDDPEAWIESDEYVIPEP